MPRYFFDSADGCSTSRDEDGLVLPDLACAKNAAVASLPDLAREAKGQSEAWTVKSRVRTETGRIVFQATLSFLAEDVA